MFPLRAATLPLFPDPTLLWSQFLFPRIPENHPTSQEVKEEKPKLTSHGHEQPSRAIGLNPVAEDVNTGPESASGLLLLDLKLSGRRYMTIICIREEGFPLGAEIQIPSAWRSLLREEDTGNICESTVYRAIGVGEEIVLRPPERSKDPQDGTGFSCDRCGKVFSYSYYRDKHLKYTRCVDNGDRKFPCPICSRSFEKRDRLRIHILHVHENHRPHCCTICGKAFSQSSSLNKHLRVHSGERPYSCPFCPKAFTASSILRTHIRQHSGEKPFKCAHCGKAFASHAAHDSHVRRTHLKTS